MGTFSLSLDAIDSASPLGFLANCLPLACVIELAGPGMLSTLRLAFLRGSGRAGTGM